MMANRILAVDDNNINLKVVSITLQHAGFDVLTAENGPAALESAKKNLPDLILLDISMPDMDGYEVCRRLRKDPATAQIPIIMLTSHDTLEEKIKGFEAGADDYLTKPFQPPELQARIRVLLRRNPAPALPEKIAPLTSPAKVLAVFSLRGGVGVSTVATNLACGLNQIWGGSVVLVDLALTLGQSALMLNMPLRNTWADLAHTPADEVDDTMLAEVIMRHQSGLNILAAPRSVEDGEKISPALVQKVLDSLCASNRYVVLDLPHDFRETSLIGLDHADQIIVLLSPEIASVRAAVGALEVFKKLGYDLGKISTVLNWTFERRGLARKDIENLLHVPMQMVIPFAPDTMVSAINLGTPPVMNVPLSPIGNLFEDFAYNASREEDQRSRPSNPTEAWLRVREREESRQAKQR